jgi:hypothetical protein
MLGQYGKQGLHHKGLALGAVVGGLLVGGQWSIHALHFKAKRSLSV